MLLLTGHDVEQLLLMEDALAAVEAGFRQLAAETVHMPQRNATPIPTHNGLHLSMPAYVGGSVDALTIKVVTVYGDNPAHHQLPMIQGVVLVHDATTGQLLSIMDAEQLTARRTGAASGIATRYLARPEAATVVLFGAGALGPDQLAAVCAVRPIQRARVITRSGSKDAAFCERMAAALQIEVEATRDVEAAVRSADVICTATNSPTPLFDGSWLQPGTHINAVGAYTAQMRELDTPTVQRSRVFVDRREAAQAEAGDLCMPMAAGAIAPEHIVGELGSVIVGDVAGRTGAEEITLFKSVGLAMQDAVTARQVYLAARAQGVGQEVTL